MIKIKIEIEFNFPLGKGRLLGVMNFMVHCCSARNRSTLLQCSILGLYSGAFSWIIEFNSVFDWL